MERITEGVKSPTKGGEATNLGETTEEIKAKAGMSEREMAGGTILTGAENIEIVGNLTGNIETGVVIGGRVLRKPPHVIVVGLGQDMEAEGAAKGVRHEATIIVLTEITTVVGKCSNITSQVKPAISLLSQEPGVIWVFSTVTHCRQKYAHSSEWLMMWRCPCKGHFERASGNIFVVYFTDN